MRAFLLPARQALGTKLKKGNNMKSTLGTALLTGAALLSGCATIVSDSKYNVAIQSDPPGAHYLVRNTKKNVEVTSGVTPGSVMLKAGNGFFSKATYEVSFDKPGYESVSVPVVSGMDGWYIGNIVFGGVIGLLILDPATGAMWRMDENVHATLLGIPEPEPEQAPPAEVPDPQAAPDVEMTESAPPPESAMVRG